MEFGGFRGAIPGPQPFQDPQGWPTPEARLRLTLPPQHHQSVHLQAFKRNLTS